MTASRSAHPPGERFFHLPVQGLHRLQSGEGALGQQLRRLCRGPALSLWPAPGDEVGIRRPGHQGQEDGDTGPLQADALPQQGAEGGQTGFQDGGEAAGHLAPDPPQSGFQIQPGPEGAGGFRGEGGEGLLCCTGGHQGALRQQARGVPAGPLRGPQPPGGPQDAAQRENGPLVGVYPAGGTEHGPLRRQPGLPEAGKGFLREEAGGLLADGDRLMPIGEQGSGAVQEGEQVHIPVAAVVVPVHQPGLGGGAHLVHQGAGGLSGQGLPVPAGKKAR